MHFIKVRNILNCSDRFVSLWFSQYHRIFVTVVMDIKQSGSDVPILSSATICLLMQISISTIDFRSTPTNPTSFANCFLTYLKGKKNSEEIFP